MKVFCLIVLMFGSIDLHAQTDSLKLFERLYGNPELETIDSLLGISSTHPASGIEYRKYRGVSKMDDPKYFFECHMIRWEGQAWKARLYGIMYTSSKSAPIRRYQSEFEVAQGIDSLKLAIENAIDSKSEKDNYKCFLSYPPAIRYYNDGVANLLVPQKANSIYTNNPLTRVTRLTYKQYSGLEQLFNRMII